MTDMEGEEVETGVDRCPEVSFGLKVRYAKVSQKQDSVV